MPVLYPQVPPPTPVVYHAILVRGQSNAVGTNADGTTDTSTAHDGDIEYSVLAGSWPSDPFTSYPPIRPVMSEDSGLGLTTTFSATANFGVERGYARTLAANGVENLLVHKVAVNGQALDPNWDQPMGGLNLYLLAGDEWAVLKANIESKGDGVSVRAMLWPQYDGDSRDASKAANYEANLTAMVDQMRIDYEAPNAPFFLIRAPSWAIGTVSGRDYVETVRAAQESYAAAHDDAFIINTDDLTHVGDYTHFTSSAKEQIGIRMANA